MLLSKDDLAHEDLEDFPTGLEDDDLRDLLDEERNDPTGLDDDVEDEEAE